jgi:formylglycine-generating enzyme required for sulfatase activity
MGSPETELNRGPYEGPQTEVTISHGFWLGKYEVTVGQFREVTGAPPSDPYPRQQAGPDLPCGNVSWNEVLQFCTALTTREREAGRLPAGFICRLPTEAEWEYACRAGTTTRFSFGDDETSLESFGWYRANSGGVPHAVGQKQPNPWGLFDMHGNVAEWCSNFLDRYPGGSVTNPVGVASGPDFAVRGGAWNLSANASRSACRSAGRSAGRSGERYGVMEVGFRVAMAPSIP